MTFGLQVRVVVSARDKVAVNAGAKNDPKA